MKKTFLLLLILPVFAVFSLHSQNQEEKRQERIQVKESASSDVQLPDSLQEELQRVDQQGDSKFYDAFLNMLTSLGLLIFLLVFALWIFKRFFLIKLNQGNETSTIKILERRALSPKSTIFVLNLFGKSVAIVESSNGVTLLTETSFKDQTSGAPAKPRSSIEM